jgi:hypothetical protein
MLQSEETQEQKSENEEKQSLVGLTPGCVIILLMSLEPFHIKYENFIEFLKVQSNLN